MVPYPADFPELAPNLGFLDGRFVSTEDQAVRSLDGSMDDAALSSAKRQLLRAGWLRRYEGRLAAPLAGDPEQFGVQLSSFVVEYASPQDAANAFAALAKQNEGAANPLVGDESLLLEFAGTTPDTNTEYRAVKLVFRVGPLLCSMTFADLTGDQPSVEMVVAAGGLVAERARIVVAEGTVPLGSMLLQFTERGDSRNDVYATRAGVQTSLLSENTLEPFALPQAAGDAFVSRLASVIANPHPAQASATDTQAVIEVEGQGSGTPLPANLTSAAHSPEISLFTILLSFNADSEASAWLSAASAEAANSHDGSLALVDAPSLGDESVAFGLGRNTDAVEQPNGYVLLARLGSVGIVQELRSSTGVSLEGAANVMRQQLACIAQFGCSGIAKIPQSIFGGRDVPLSVNLTGEAPQERVGTEAQAAVLESAPEAKVSATVTEPQPVTTVEEPAAIESAAEVPEELTEPEIISAPEPEETPEAAMPAESSSEPAPTPTAESESEPASTTTPIVDDPQAPVGSQETPAPVVAETPDSSSSEIPVAPDDAATEVDTTTLPSETADVPVPESTAAPVPADAPIGASSAPPGDEVVQTPAETDPAAGTSPDFTEPAPAVTESEPANDGGDRESRRDRDRKKDREEREDKK